MLPPYTFLQRKPSMHHYYTPTNTYPMKQKKPRVLSKKGGQGKRAKEKKSKQRGRKRCELSKGTYATSRARARGVCVQHWSALKGTKTFSNEMEKRAQFKGEEVETTFLVGTSLYLVETQDPFQFPGMYTKHRWGVVYTTRTKN